MDQNNNRETWNREGIWRDGVLGVVTGDALGCPVQFRSREEVERNPITGMEGYGTFNLPPGSWTDDSSLTLATLDSIRATQGLDLDDMMHRFVRWMYNGEYTPYGESFDIGIGTMQSIRRYLRQPDVNTCGGREASNNGNGSLMRILPVCLYCFLRQQEDGMSDEEALELIHGASGLTHAHLRSMVGCGLYYFMVRQLPQEDSPLIDRLQRGIDEGFAFYMRDLDTTVELSPYGALRNLYAFAGRSRAEIQSSGYVVHTLEAAVWSLLNTDSFEEALLLAVNLGEDTDTVGAVCGGLAGLYYGSERIPTAWLEALERREWIESLCVEVLTRQRKQG